MSKPEVPPTTPLPQQTRLILSLSALCAAVHPATPPSPSNQEWHNVNALAWLRAVCKLVNIDTANLPGEVDVDTIRSSTKEAASERTEDEKKRMASVLIEASLAVEAEKAKANKEEALRYTPLARALAHRTLDLLSLAPKYLPQAERDLGTTLFKILQADSSDKVESTVASHSQGWGGSLGRKLATGAGVIAGGVLIGVTGGLAAPAIAALLAPLGIGGLLAGGAAPVVLGTLFGVGGGGLAGKRVRERWRGVEEFSFLEVGAGTMQTKEEEEEMKAAKERVKARRQSGQDESGPKEFQSETDKEEKEVESQRDQLEEKLLDLHVNTGSIEKGPKPPSLTATIVVPGLLSVSQTEALTAWRAICSSESGLNDGRDVYYLQYESAMMLKAGREIDSWVTSKVKGKLKGEIIKRTVLNAYFAAVKLPMTVYSMASMSLDNTWMQAVDRANKAGRILGEVLEKRVQGERPVILIGSSLGALTIFKALLYLSSIDPKPVYVESAFLISLPSEPTDEEWKKCRGVVARRLVNAYSEADWVLAGVVRLHEVISRAATLNSGLSPAGLAPVNQPGVQDIDVGTVLKGHMELQAKMADIIRIVDVDA